MTQAFGEIFLAEANATQKLGKQIAMVLPANSIILLCGELGAGKTTLVQGVGEGLGITTPIVSPTFTLINEYTEGRLPLYHLDLYRLDNSEAIAELCPESYWEGQEVIPGITAIEWADRLPYWPDSYLRIELHQTEQSRQATLEMKSLSGDRQQAIQQLLTSQQ